MILESNALSIVLADDKPQTLKLRLKTKIHMTYSGDYWGAAYGPIDYLINVKGLVKDQATLNLTQTFFEQVDNNKFFYTDHNGQKWDCHLNPDEQSVRRQSKEVWVLSLRLIGVEL